MLNLAPYISVIWFVFWVYWIVRAFGAKNSKYNFSNFIGLRIGVFIVLLLVIRWGIIRPGNLDDHNAYLQIVGLLLFLASLSLAIWARAYLGRNWGMPMSKKRDPELVTTGPYEYIRHPIYTGIMLAMVGTALATTFYWFAGVAIISAYFIYAATVEERNMSQQFPKVYPGYKKRTKMLLPFIF